ncbi:MAG: hypothetical protein Q7T03_04815 [Deltaproteobacteria bacterium]|nr:hypothetical protein [Deltaproteobacteria bacterium]
MNAPISFSVAPNFFSANLSFVDGSITDPSNPSIFDGAPAELRDEYLDVMRQGWRQNISLEDVASRSIDIFRKSFMHEVQKAGGEADEGELGLAVEVFAERRVELGFSKKNRIEKWVERHPDLKTQDLTWINLSQTAWENLFHTSAEKGSHEAQQELEFCVKFGVLCGLGTFLVEDPEQAFMELAPPNHFPQSYRIPDGPLLLGAALCHNPYPARIHLTVFPTSIEELHAMTAERVRPARIWPFYSPIHRAPRQHPYFALAHDIGFHGRVMGLIPASETGTTILVSQTIQETSWYQRGFLFAQETAADILDGNPLGVRQDFEVIANKRLLGISREQRLFILEWYEKLVETFQDRPGGRRLLKTFRKTVGKGIL